jgi:Ca2+-binding RTX toxin-like protein
MLVRENAAIVESLETRKLFSGAAIVNGVLRVHGDRWLKNVITVGLAVDGKISVNISATNAKGATRTFSEEFATTGINSVRIFGGRRADHIAIDQTVANFNLNIINGGRGADTLIGGSENDTLFGGAGNDVINSGDGNDVVYGGRGDDSITAGNGNDTLWGGCGADTIIAGNGNDVLGGILGKNTLEAGSGHNTFYVTSLSNNITNFDATKDTLKIVEHGDCDSNSSGDTAAASI